MEVGAVGDLSSQTANPRLKPSGEEEINPHFIPSVVF